MVLTNGGILWSTCLSGRSCRWSWPRSSGSPSHAVQFANDAGRDGARGHFSLSVRSATANCVEFSAGHRRPRAPRSRFLAPRQARSSPRRGSYATKCLQTVTSSVTRIGVRSVAVQGPPCSKSVTIRSYAAGATLFWAARCGKLVHQLGDPAAVVIGDLEDLAANPLAAVVRTCCCAAHGLTRSTRSPTVAIRARSLSRRWSTRCSVTKCDCRWARSARRTSNVGLGDRARPSDGAVPAQLDPCPCGDAVTVAAGTSIIRRCSWSPTRSRRGLGHQHLDVVAPAVRLGGGASSSSCGLTRNAARWRRCSCRPVLHLERESPPSAENTSTVALASCDRMLTARSVSFVSVGWSWCGFVIGARRLA